MPATARGQAQHRQTDYTNEVSQAEPLAFVVQRHELADGSVHWDLMFQQPHAERLATWQLPCPPERIPADGVIARKLADHRPLYLTYEGPVSNDRGQVAIHSRGTYTATQRRPDRWQVELHGPTGGLRLFLSAGPAPDQWRVEIGR